MEHPFLMFVDHTQRRSTIGRTPLDEWSARRRDLYLTTHDTHNRQISMPPVGLEPKISAGERPQAAHLLRSWVRIPPGAWIFVCCECRVLSGRGLCDELITRPEEPYRLWWVVVCDLEKSREWGGHDPRWDAAPQKNHLFNNIFPSEPYSFKLPLSFTFSHHNLSHGTGHESYATRVFFYVDWHK